MLFGGAVRNVLRALSTTALLFASTSACNEQRSVGPEPPPVVPDNCSGATNALDQAVCSELFQQDYKPLIAADEEVCTRLFVDLTGVRGSGEELRQGCIGKPIAEVIDVLQKNESYRKTMRRRW